MIGVMELGITVAIRMLLELPGQRKGIDGADFQELLSGGRRRPRAWRITPYSSAAKTRAAAATAAVISQG